MELLSILEWSPSFIDKVYQVNSPNLTALFEATWASISARQAVFSSQKERDWKNLPDPERREACLSHLQKFYYGKQETSGGTPV